jgi:intracellular sulfur oxidation DsrE/DsrF family protein
MNIRLMPIRLALLALGMAFMIPDIVYAQTATVGMPDEPHFVEHRLALQLSDESEEKQTLVLNNASNVLKFYGLDKVAIEIVTFGPGVELLREGNPNAARISSLIGQGVRFDVCMNTLEAMERKSGKPFPLNPHSIKVTAGVVQLITLAEHGYTVIHP